MVGKVSRDLEIKSKIIDELMKKTYKQTEMMRALKEETNAMRSRSSSTGRVSPFRVSADKARLSVGNPNLVTSTIGFIVYFELSN